MPDTDLTSPDKGTDFAGQWVSVSELAGIKGLTRQSLSERVSRLVRQGRLSTRPGKGKQKLVNLAEFDRAVGETTDLAKATGAETKRNTSAEPPGAPPDSVAATYTREQARQKGYQADIAGLDLEERLGKLVPVHQIEAATIAFGEIMVRILDQLHLKADEAAAAVAKDGVIGARTWLKATARHLRGRMADELTKLATGGAVGDAATSDCETSDA